MIIKKIIACLLAGVCFISFNFKPSYYESCCHEAAAVEVIEEHQHDEHSFELIKKNVYQNHCWRCKSDINSNVNARCSKCGWYICKKCGACESTCPRCPSWNGGSSSSSSGSNNSWVWILVIGGVVVVGVIIYRKKMK